MVWWPFPALAGYFATDSALSIRRACTAVRQGGVTLPGSRRGGTERVGPVAWSSQHVGWAWMQPWQSGGLLMTMG
ncbi:MAG: hypothetical protein OWU33_16355 [Firmicutes bacterium]|nr:hypothetical protein [Bacillota bacterium]